MIIILSNYYSAKSIIAPTSLDSKILVFKYSAIIQRVDIFGLFVLNVRNENSKHNGRVIGFLTDSISKENYWNRFLIWKSYMAIVSKLNIKPHFWLGG